MKLSEWLLVGYVSAFLTMLFVGIGAAAPDPARTAWTRSPAPPSSAAGVSGPPTPDAATIATIGGMTPRGAWTVESVGPVVPYSWDPGGSGGGWNAGRGAPAPSGPVVALFDTGGKAMPDVSKIEGGLARFAARTSRRHRPAPCSAVVVQGGPVKVECSPRRSCHPPSSRRSSPPPSWSAPTARRRRCRSARTGPTAALITANDDWAGVPGIVGFRGTAFTDGSPSTPDWSPGIGTTPGDIDVNANQTDPHTFTTGGVTEFAITNPAVALAGIGHGRAPFLLLTSTPPAREHVSLQSPRHRRLRRQRDPARRPPLPRRFDRQLHQRPRGLRGRRHHGAQPGHASRPRSASCCPRPPITSRWSRSAS